VQGFLQRKCACGNHTAAGGECAECEKKRKDRQGKADAPSAPGAALSGSRLSVLQPKRTLGASNDLLEQEADHVADQVLAAPARPAVGAPLLQRFIRQPPEQVDVVPPTVDRVLAGPGTPLEPALQQDMAQRFGHDFSRVRVHFGATAEQSALEVNAAAYTVGSHLVFGAGRFAPGTHEGRRLLAHELTHVVQQSGAERIREQRGPNRLPGAMGHELAHSVRQDARAGAPQVQRKVVTDDRNSECRALPGRSFADLTARENEAATLAENAAAAVRATPPPEPIRALIWKRFRLDYNDPVARCRFLPEIGDRFARIAREIRNTDCTYVYLCAISGEPSSDCSTALAVTHLGWFGGQRIDLCSRFWTIGHDQQAFTLLHEWAHYVFATRGLLDEPLGGFDTAECYNAFASEFAGQPVTGPEDVNCVPNTSPLPALNQGRLRLPCTANVFLNLPVLGGYAYGLPGAHHYLTAGVGLDYLFPLTRLHDWELAVGGRFLHFTPTDSSNRDAYLLGVRAGLAFRYRPWRFGTQVGGYAEGGGINVPVGATGERTLPYAAAGISAGLNFRIGRQTALQILAEVGGGVGFDTRNDEHFGWFQSGLSAVFQFQ
jgi:hypothetical protein